MNRKMTVGLVAVCSLVLGATLIVQESGDASSKVKQLEKEFSQAQMNSDANWYEQHLADGYAEGDSWGDWTTRADAINQMQDKSIKFKRGDMSDLKVATFGPNLAIAHYKFTYDATFNGTHRARTVICSDTWVSQSGDWKLAWAHCSHVEGK